MESTELAPDVPQLQTDQPHSNRATDSKNDAPGDTPDSSWAPDHGRRVTLEDYWEKWYENPYPDLDVSYEWNNGILEAKPPSNAPQIRLYNWFLFLLYRYLETFDHASLINLETGFVLKIEDESDPKGKRVQVHKPDIGVILNANPVSWGALDQRHFDGVCDMVVESVSDSTMVEVLRDTEEKKSAYALGGVKEYYILDPEGEHIRFYALTSEGTYKEIPPDANGLIRSNVLAGLQFRLDDLHRRPGLVELTLDNVYSEYVLPKLRAAIIRAETASVARGRADEQAATASAARKRAEEKTATDLAARKRAEELAATEAAARQRVEERVKALEAELARLRSKSS